MTIDPRIEAAALAMRETRGANCLTEYVRRACNARGIPHYHTHDSRHSQKGFPDFVIALKTGPLFVELKKQKTRTSEYQVWWLNYFARSGQRCFLWRPSHWLDGTIDWILGDKKYAILWGDPFHPLIEAARVGRWQAGAGVPGDKFSLPVVGSKARRAR